LDLGCGATPSVETDENPSPRTANAVRGEEDKNECGGGIRGVKAVKGIKGVKAAAKGG